MDEEYELEEDLPKRESIFRKLLRWIFRIFLLLVAAIAALFLIPEEEEETQKAHVIREGPKPIENPQYLDLGPIIVNLRGGQYFLKTHIQLGFENPEPKMWMEARLPLIKDLIISQLQTLSAKKAVDPKVRILLKEDLMTKLNSFFPNEPPWQDPKPIKRILFQEFYRQ